jgi:hypothetical protein
VEPVYYSTWLPQYTQCNKNSSYQTIGPCSQPLPARKMKWMWCYLNVDKKIRPMNPFFCVWISPCVVGVSVVEDMAPLVGPTIIPTVCKYRTYVHPLSPLANIETQYSPSLSTEMVTGVCRSVLWLTWSVCTSLASPSCAITWKPVTSEQLLQEHVHSTEMRLEEELVVQLIYISGSKAPVKKACMYVTHISTVVHTPCTLLIDTTPWYINT